MRAILTAVPICLLAACSTPSSPFTPNSTFSIDRGPNTAPRGSDEFCRTYASQTAVNRLDISRNGNGRGPNGFDRQIAGLAGERAYQRCRAGRTN